MFLSLFWYNYHGGGVGHLGSFLKIIFETISKAHIGNLVNLIKSESGSFVLMDQMHQ